MARRQVDLANHALDLAVTLHRHDNPDAAAVVSTATKFYAFLVGNDDTP